MNKEQKLNKINKDFLEGHITWRQYWEFFDEYKIGSQSPWSRKEWKENRKKKLKDKCECCGTTENLTIQHTWHPDGFEKVCSQETNRIAFGGGEIPPFSGEIEPVYVMKQFCPVCDGPSVRYRKTIGNYKCYTQRRLWKKEFSFMEGIECPSKEYDMLSEHQRRTFESARPWWNKGISKNHKETKHCDAIFDSPATKQVMDEKETKKQRKVAEREHERDFIGPVATKIVILQHQRYVEMRDEDHITACRGCAFKQDLKSGKIAQSRHRAFSRKIKKTLEVISEK